MAGNKEKKIYTESVDIFLAIARTKDGQKAQCIRTVVKDYNLDLAFLEAKLRVLGGEWRIHKTVNPRCVEKARIVLLKMLIEHPEMGSYVDSQWRTALLQRECTFGEKKFMFDVDTKDTEKILKLEELIEKGLQEIYKKSWDMSDMNIDKIETPNGWHYITRGFDSREVCKLDYVSLLRDGYVFVKAVRNTEGN